MANLIEGSPDPSQTSEVCASLGNAVTSVIEAGFDNSGLFRGCYDHMVGQLHRAEGVIEHVPTPAPDIIQAIHQARCVIERRSPLHR